MQSPIHKETMQKLWKLWLSGLITILPVAITLYLIYWLGITTERFFGQLLQKVLPDQYYWPGLGLISGFIVLILLGIVVHAWLVKRVITMGENLFNHIPLVKSVYSSIKDFLNYFTASMTRRRLERVVLVNFGDFQLIGFVTLDEAGALPFAGMIKEDTVLVYFPMSYQIGGYTLYISKTKIQTVHMSVEDAMRLTLTAGLSGTLQKSTDENIPPAPTIT